MPQILPIGKLDRLITIQEATDTQGSDYGDNTKSWATWKSPWANVKHFSGGEKQEARQIYAEVKTRFQIRWVSGLSPKMRISYDGRYYDIYEIEEVGRRQRWNIWARAIQT